MHLPLRTAARRPGRARAAALVAVALATALGTVAVVGRARPEEHALAARAALERAAERLMERAAAELTTDFRSACAGRRGDAAELARYLDALGIRAPEGDAEPVPTSLLGRIDVEAERARIPELRRVAVAALDVARSDGENGPRLEMRATVSRRGTGDDPPVTSRAVFVTEPARWEGLDYALLANDLSCVLCHTAVDSAARRDGAEEVARVRVGALDTLLLQRDADSYLAGALYLRGTLRAEDGSEVSDWADCGLEARAFDSDGRLVLDRWGELQEDGLRPSAEGAAAPNLWLDYGRHGLPQPDGWLPGSFPAVFADDGGRSAAGAGNRRVDPAEFRALAARATGTLTGGALRVLAREAGATEGTVEALGAVVAGTVLAVGTAERPLVLRDDVAIAGDLVLHGVVAGEGTLLVAGNVYLPGDVVRADPERGGALAIAAGGSILVGDVFHPRWGRGTVTGDRDGSFSFVLDALARFNRRAWTRTEPRLPGPGDDPDDARTWRLANPSYAGPGARARYYAFGDGDPVPVLRDGSRYDPELGTWIGRELGSSWDPTRLRLADPEDASDPLLGGPEGARPAVLTVADEELRALVTSAFAGRPRGRAFRVEAALYTDAALVAVVPRQAGGKLLVRGALIAPDLAILAPEGFQLDWDARAAALLPLRSRAHVGLRRLFEPFSG